MKQILEQRAKVFEQARALLIKAENEARALTAEEQTEYDKRMADVKAMGDTLERSRKSAEMEAELSRSIGPRETGTEQRKAPGSDLTEAALDTFLRSGVSALTQEQRAAFGQAVTGKGDQLHFRAVYGLAEGTGGYGGYTVPQGFYNQLDIARKWYGGVLQAEPTILRTASGNDLPFPSMNDTANVGELVAENVGVGMQAQGADIGFGRIILKAYKYSSKLVFVPIELMQDSAFDVQGLVAKALGERLGRIQNTHFTTGDGTNKPTGLITQAALGVTGTTGQTGKWIYDDIVNLIHSVDPAYRIGAKFMMHDSSAAVTELMKDGNGRPLLNSSFAGIGQAVSGGDANNPLKYTILGYPVVINNDMATMAANAKSVAFGDFSKVIVRQVLDFMLVRFGEKFMDQGQIGFLAFERADSNVQDAGTNPLKYYKNSAT